VRAVIALEYLEPVAYPSISSTPQYKLGSNFD
jgi:hypothetical protein